VIAPAQTPRGILIKLNTTINVIVAMDDVHGRVADLGMKPIGTGSIEDLQQFLQSEIPRWATIVEAAGLAKTE